MSSVFFGGCRQLDRPCVDDCVVVVDIGIDRTGLCSLSGIVRNRFGAIELLLVDFGNMQRFYRSGI